MPRHEFILNLRDTTFHSRFRSWLKPRGYLLAPNRATKSVVELARNVRRKKLRLYADNGNFAVIGRVRSRFAEEAETLLAAVREEEKGLGRRIRPGELGPELTAKFAGLAESTATAGEQATNGANRQIEKQLSLNPSRLIGSESITMALWLALNLEPEYLPFSRDRYRTINEATARRSLQELRMLSPSQKRYYYPVASAVSYDTAFDAGTVFASHGLRRISMGFGAYMADNNYADHMVINGKAITLTQLMPNRYLRTILVARGFWDGYVARAGRPPQGFHFLGLGAPIMVGLVSLAAWGTPDISFDATSPIKDAVEGTLYCSKPAYLKIRTRRTALRLASREGEEWSCPCPFCKAFATSHPFDYDRGRAWFLAHPDPEVSQKDLDPDGGLFEAYPLLAEPDNGPLRAEVDFARIGHNHWILQDIMSSLNVHATSRDDLAGFMEKIVTAYRASTSSELFAESIRLAKELALGRLPV